MYSKEMTITTADQKIVAMRCPKLHDETEEVIHSIPVELNYEVSLQGLDYSRKSTYNQPHVPNLTELQVLFETNVVTPFTPKADKLCSEQRIMDDMLKEGLFGHSVSHPCPFVRTMYNYSPPLISGGVGVSSLNFRMIHIHFVSVDLATCHDFEERSTRWTLIKRYGSKLAHVP